MTKRRTCALRFRARHVAKVDRVTKRHFLCVTVYVVVTGGGDKSRTCALSDHTPFDRPRQRKYHIRSRASTRHRAPAPAMASAAATPTACSARGLERVAARRSVRPGGRSGFPDRGPVRVVCRTTRFSEQFGDAGAPKPGTLQSPPLYVKRTLRGGQTVRHPGSVIVRHISRVPSPDALAPRDRRPTFPHSRTVERVFAMNSFFPPPQRAFRFFTIFFFFSNRMFFKFFLLLIFFLK